MVEGAVDIERDCLASLPPASSIVHSSDRFSSTTGGSSGAGSTGCAFFPPNLRRSFCTRDSFLGSTVGVRSTTESDGWSLPDELIEFVEAWTESRRLIVLRSEEEEEGVERLGRGEDAPDESPHASCRS